MLKLLAAFGGIKLWTPFADAEILQERTARLQHLDNESHCYPDIIFPIQPKSHLHSGVSPPRRTLLKGKSCGKVHAGRETKRICV